MVVDKAETLTECDLDDENESAREAQGPGKGHKRTALWFSLKFTVCIQRMFGIVLGQNFV